MKQNLLGLLLLAIFPAALLAQTPGKYVKVYRGDEGLRVVTVDLEGAEKGKALVSISGIASQFDGLVFKATLEGSGTGDSYVITVEGSEYHLVRTEREWVGVMTVYLPEKRDGIRVGYDEKESAKKKPAELVAAWSKMAKNPKYLKVTTFDRKAKEAAADKDLVALAQEAASACGTKPVAIKVAWDTIPDELLKRLSIPSFCGAPASALRSVCGSDEKLKAKAGAVTAFQCRFGADMTLKLGADGGVAWSTAESASNQDEFARAVMQNELRLR